MRFNEQVHWADGLFLQPQHFQTQQRFMLEHIRNERTFFLPYRYGFIDLSIDQEALLNRRVVVQRLAVLMPDNQELSMPGNCTVAPLTLDKPGVNDSSTLTVYLVLPNFSINDANLDNDGSRRRMYALTERTVLDENTGDNEILLLTRVKNPRLAADISRITNSSVIPLLHLKWVSYHGQDPVLALDDAYMPPFVLVSPDCRLGNMVSELLFQIKSCRANLTSALQSSAAPGLTELLFLTLLNEAELRLTNLASPYRTTPYNLYLELAGLLAKLQALDYASSPDPIPEYDHDDALPVFRQLLSLIRSIISPQGATSFTRVDFEPVPGSGRMQAALEQSGISEQSELFLALYGVDLTGDRLNEDNFRLVDAAALNLRIRGLKLQQLKAYPRQLPAIGGALWFKVDAPENRSMFTRVLNDKMLYIDKAAGLFEGLKASLFVITSE